MSIDEEHIFTYCSVCFFPFFLSGIQVVNTSPLQFTFHKYCFPIVPLDHFLALYFDEQKHLILMKFICKFFFNCYYFVSCLKVIVCPC